MLNPLRIQPGRSTAPLPDLCRIPASTSQIAPAVLRTALGPGPGKRKPRASATFSWLGAPASTRDARPKGMRSVVDGVLEPGFHDNRRMSVEGYAQMLVLATARIGPNCVTEEFLGWVNGKPIPIWQCFLLKVVLNDVRILPNDALVTVSASRMSSRRRARWCSYIFWIGKYLRKSRRGFALI